MWIPAMALCGMTLSGPVLVYKLQHQRTLNGRQILLESNSAFSYSESMSSQFYQDWDGDGKLDLRRDISLFGSGMTFERKTSPAKFIEADRIYAQLYQSRR
jgi:hypothetical protein